MTPPRWAAPVFFLAVAAVWSWPALVSQGLLGRMPDAAGTAWFIWASTHLWPGLDDGLTGWPVGAHYGRPDSYSLLLWGGLLQGVDPARAHAWLGLVGPTLSAWAAEAFARATGARAPWSWLAGLAFVFSGLGSSALLEGYSYHLLDPWLPLLGLFWYRATQPEGRAWHGAAAGLCFLACLATTAWLALAAAPLVVGLWVGSLGRRGPVAGWRPIGAAACVVVPPLVGFMLAFLAGGGADGLAPAGAPNPARPLTWGLVQLASPLTTVDVHGNSQANTLPAVALCLAIAAPVVLRGQPGWRALACAGGLSLALSLLVGGWEPAPVGAASVGLAEVWATLRLALGRFPDRLAWSGLLCVGVLAARVATVLSDRRRSPRTWPLLVFALVDVFVVLRMPWRQQVSTAAVPSAYRAAAGPVLDLWPEERAAAPAWTLRTTNLGCYYQTGHGRPIADLCITSPGVQSPRLRLGQWVSGRLLADESAAVAERLGSLGFSTVALHPDPFDPADRERLMQALARIDPSPTQSTDGGERVVAYAIPHLPDARPRAAWATWTALQPSGPGL